MHLSKYLIFRVHIKRAAFFFINIDRLHRRMPEGHIL